MADGGYRDALTLLDQAFLTSDGKVTLQLVYDQLGLIADEVADGLLAAMAECDVKGIVVRLDEIYRTGRDPRSIVESLILRLSELTRAAYGVDVGALADSSLEAGLTATAGQLGKEKILKFRSDLAAVHRHARDVSLPRVWVEAELVRTALAAAAPTPVAVERQPAPKKAAEPAASKPAETPAPKRPKKRDIPLPDKPKPTGDESFDKLAVAWHEVVLALSTMSPSAAEHLTKCALADVSDKTATVAFHRQSDAEWMSDSTKVQRAAYEIWNKHGGDGFRLKFVGDGSSKPRRPAPEAATVELPAEGEQLEKLGQEVFGQAGTANDRGA